VRKSGLAAEQNNLDIYSPTLHGGRYGLYVASKRFHPLLGDRNQSYGLLFEKKKSDLSLSGFVRQRMKSWGGS
jgi:hypothetical protein